MYLNPIKDWFYFSSWQRKGIIVLMSLIIIIPIAGRLIEARYRGRGFDEETFFRKLQAFEEYLAWLNEASEQHGQTDRHTQNINESKPAVPLQLRPVPFDPNTISQNEWENMGVPGYLARTIDNYLAAGGNFRYKEDLQRIYLMEDEIYHALEGFIQLPGRANRPSGNEISGSKTDNHTTKTSRSSLANTGEEKHAKDLVAATGPLVININLADTTELQKIRGIGQVFSRRIVRYRELLGGYHCATQLLEVYGIDSARFDQIRDHVETGKGPVYNKLNLNQAEFGDLVRHPYIDRNIANAILNLRAQHGPFTSPDEIKRSYLIDELTWAKVAPYVGIGED